MKVCEKNAIVLMKSGIVGTSSIVRVQCGNYYTNPIGRLATAICDDCAGVDDKNAEQFLFIREMDKNECPF